MDPIEAVLDAFLTWTNVGENLSEGMFNLVIRLWDAWAAIKAFLEPIIEAVSNFVQWKDVLIALGLAVAAVVLPALAGILAAAAQVGLVVGGLIAAIAAVRNAWESDWMGIRTADRECRILVCLIWLAKHQGSNRVNASGRPNILGAMARHIQAKY